MSLLPVTPIGDWLRCAHRGNIGSAIKSIPGWIRRIRAAEAARPVVDAPAFPRREPHRKLCGSTSTATFTPPRGCGAAASSARKKPCRSAERGALAARRKRWRLRRTAIGASAGPSSDDLVVLRLSAERRDAPALARRHRVGGPGERAGVRLRRALVLARDDDRREPAERRQAADSPLLRLLRVEPFRVARNQRRDHRMVGLPGLQQGVALAFGPSGPPGRLAQELEGALGGARIGVGEADVGVDDADEGQKREVVALGDQLRADDEVELAARRGVELAAQGLDPAGEVGRQHQRAGVREKQRRLLRQPLDARPAGGQAVDVVAFRAKPWARLDMAAMVADERGAEAVLDQPGRAVRALEPVAAGAAEGERRIAAPVEEQKRLLAAPRAPPRSP